MLPEEQATNSRYLIELGPARFGYREELLPRVQAFHFKSGQAAKTGSGGYLPASKVTARIAAIRGIPEGQPIHSPPTFVDLHSPGDFRAFADRVRELTGGIPVGFKLSAQHIEADLDFALEAGADYLILDGRGGGTGAAPLLLRDHIGVPTIPALSRARAHLDRRGASGRVTLIATGGLRTPADCVKALALGADGIALANAAIQAIALAGVLVPAEREARVSISASQRHGADPEDLAAFRPQRHLEGDETVTLLPFGGGERVCLGKALAELEIRLLAMGLLKQLSFGLEPNQDLTLAVIPSPSPQDGLLVLPRRRATAADLVGSGGAGYDEQLRKPSARKLPTFDWPWAQRPGAESQPKAGPPLAVGPQP